MKNPHSPISCELEKKCQEYQNLISSFKYSCKFGKNQCPTLKDVMQIRQCPTDANVDAEANANAIRTKNNMSPFSSNRHNYEPVVIIKIRRKQSLSLDAENFMS